MAAGAYCQAMGAPVWDATVPGTGWVARGYSLELPRGTLDCFCDAVEVVALKRVSGRNNSSQSSSPASLASFTSAARVTAANDQQLEVAGRGGWIVSRFSGPSNKATRSWSMPGRMVGQSGMTYYHGTTRTLVRSAGGLVSV